MAKSNDDNWHIDGHNCNSVSTFNILWGVFINPLKEGGMGNLIVYPGTHHIIANVLKTEGPIFCYDGAKEKVPTFKINL